MEFIIIFFLSNGIEHLHSKVEYCDFEEIWNLVDKYESETDNNVTGWACFDEKTFILREKARKRLGIDV